MRWSDLLEMSISSLKRRKLRSFLTVLGVVIGTASIVVMISLGLGLQESMYKEVEQDGGAAGITVTGKDTGSGMYMSGMGEQEESEKYITDDTIKDLRTLEHVKSAEPVLNLSATALKGRYEGSLEICGMTPEGLASLDLELEPGGTLPDPDSAQLELVYGNAILTNFYEKGTGKTYWDTGERPDIDLKNDSLFLILDQEGYYQTQNVPQAGVSAVGESGTGDAGSQGTGQLQTAPKKYVVKGSGVIAGGIDSYHVNSFSAYCDINKLREFLQKEFRGRAIPGQPSTKSGKPYSKFVYSSAKIQADRFENVDQVSAAIRSLGYNVTTNAEYIDSMKKQLAMIQAVLGGIGAVSLLVAAIGIANTMMMSIYERTKEIGIMKVIGCGLKNIRQMFLLEAAFIGLAGGIIGNVLSLVMSSVINMLSLGGSMGVSGNISYIPVWLILASVVFAVLVGTAAGYFPARRAMRLSPLAAIHNE